LSSSFSIKTLRICFVIIERKIIVVRKRRIQQVITVRRRSAMPPYSRRADRKYLSAAIRRLTASLAHEIYVKNGVNYIDLNIG